MAASLRILAKGKLSTMQPALKAIITRTCPVLLSRGLSVTSTRLSNGGIPTDAEQATGLEKKEYDALAAGIDDPFNMKPYEGPPGTKDKPLEVLSMFDERIIGCICEPEATSIVWNKLHLNEVTRCECGHFFVLRRGNPIKIEMDHGPGHH
ncbi:cytochrome c oxidase subunit 5B, mitochondrial-like [Pocillopora verrucosa]|uniref:cytochrome c oxidase subunit 5B, mitochondrial-like n=1 Tax=Pocillopora verrucosa TaxID=203993 RepID=UPI0027970537|nr:cytochrome c oxidase subunit 5B, mitochondrial-like [Pocillopora verrucosa]